MQKKIAAFAVAGAVVIGGAAVAVPALAADSSTSADATSGPVDAIKNALKGLVSDKTITQDQADKVAEALGKPGALPGGGHRGGPGGMGFGVMQEGIDAAATALGMSADDVRTALRDGSTLADLAKKQGKSTDDVTNALVDVAKTKLAEAVKSGRLTQDRADEIEKNLPDQIKQFVENGRPAGKGMRGGFGGGPGGDRGATPGETPGETPTETPSPSATGSSTLWVPAQATASI